MSREAMRMALEALEGNCTNAAADPEQAANEDAAITALRQALETPKYRRGDRLLCLETEEYCVIHISGTDRQYVKFPDGHVGQYTNQQVAEHFELLPKEVDADDTSQERVDEIVKDEHDKQVTIAQAYERGWNAALAQQEPVAWANSFDLQNFDMKVRTGPDLHHTVPLYTAPPKREWVGLTDEEIAQGLKESWVTEQAWQSAVWWAEAKLKEKNG